MSDDAEYDEIVADLIRIKEAAILRCYCNAYVARTVEGTWGGFDPERIPYTGDGSHFKRSYGYDEKRGCFVAASEVPDVPPVAVNANGGCRYGAVVIAGPANMSGGYCLSPILAREVGYSNG